MSIFNSGGGSSNSSGGVGTLKLDKIILKPTGTTSTGFSNSSWSSKNSELGYFKLLKVEDKVVYKVDIQTRPSAFSSLDGTDASTDLITFQQIDSSKTVIGHSFNTNLKSVGTSSVSTMADGVAYHKSSNNYYPIQLSLGVSHFYWDIKANGYLSYRGTQSYQSLFYHSIGTATIYGGSFGRNFALYGASNTEIALYIYYTD